MKAIFVGNGWAEYCEIAEVEQKTFKKINKMIESIVRNGHEGISGAEPLKHNFSGYWSKRIDLKHRLIYRLIDGETIEILKCKGHYEDK